MYLRVHREEKRYFDVPQTQDIRRNVNQYDVDYYEKHTIYVLQSFIGKDVLAQYLLLNVPFYRNSTCCIHVGLFGFF